MVYKKRTTPTARDFICFLLSFVLAYMCGYFLILFENNNSIDCFPSSERRELENDDFLFIAVHTSNSKFSTKVQAVLNTWGHQVPGKLLFFVDGIEDYNGSLPILGLKDIAGDASSAVKTLFSIIKYVTNEYDNRYQWLMITSDNVFINIRSLEKFLRSVDGQRRPQYIGKSVKGGYCLKDNGIILSRSTLVGIKHHLNYCIRHSVTPYGDLELGQCIQRYVGITCSRAIEFGELFVTVPNPTHFFPDMVSEKTLTLQPTGHQLLYQWYQHFLLLRFTATKITVNDRYKKITQFSELISKLTKDETVVVKSNAKKLGHEMFYKIYNTSAYLRVERFLLKDTNMTGCVLSPTKYQRFSQGNLMENIFIKECRDRTQSLQTVQLYTSPEVQIPEVDMSKTIWIILPLYKKVQAYSAFLNMLLNSISKFSGRVNLRVVLHVDKEGNWKTSNHISDKMKHKINLNVTTVDTIFSRGNALTIGTRGLPSATLLLFMDVDMTFDENFLKRVLFNTIYKKQVYFPICFSQFDPLLICYNHTQCDISITEKDNKFGVWRRWGYGMMSIYKGDFTRVGGFDSTIKNWGMEDVMLYNRCARTGLTIFRSVDPSLVHLFHPKECKETKIKADNISMCVSKLSQAGNEHTLYNILSNFTNL